MASSLVITVNSGGSSAELDKYIGSTTEPRQECVKLRNLFDRLAGGLEAANFSVAKASAAAVAAKGTVTIDYTKLSATDTVVIGGVTLTCVAGAPGALEFRKISDIATTATNLKNLINATATLNVYGVATVVTTTGVVTYTLFQKGVVGNIVPLAVAMTTPSALVASGTTLTGGTGGVSGAAVSYSRGL